MIEQMQPERWPYVAAIYAEGIATGDATFETVVPPWAGWDASHLVEPRCAAVKERVPGRAAAPDQLTRTQSAPISVPSGRKRGHGPKG